MGLCKCHYFFAGSFASLDAAAAGGNDVIVNLEWVRHCDIAALKAMTGLGFLAKQCFHVPSNVHTTVARNILLLQAISSN